MREISFEGFIELLEREDPPPVGRDVPVSLMPGGLRPNPAMERGKEFIYLRLVGDEDGISGIRPLALLFVALPHDHGDARDGAAIEGVDHPFVGDPEAGAAGTGAEAVVVSNLFHRLSSLL